jgi:hypothetical protein
VRSSKVTPDEIFETVRGFPKGDLHNHLTLGISRKRFALNFPGSGVEFPLSYRGLPGMLDMVHNVINPVMNSREAVLTFCRSAIEDARIFDMWSEGSHEGKAAWAKVDNGWFSGLGSETDIVEFKFHGAEIMRSPPPLFSILR